MTNTETTTGCTVFRDAQGTVLYAFTNNGETLFIIGAKGIERLKDACKNNEGMLIRLDKWTPDRAIIAGSVEIDLHIGFEPQEDAINMELKYTINGKHVGDKHVLRGSKTLLNPLFDNYSIVQLVASPSSHPQ